MTELIARERSTVEPSIDRALRRKMARRGTVVHEPQELSKIESRLREFLGTRVDGDFTVAGLRRLPGGASKEQFMFELTWDHNEARRTDSMVLRMDPPASMVETLREREFQVLRAVRPVVPVPEVFWVADEAELGASSLICGFMTGSASASDATKTASGLGTTYGARLRGLLAPQFVDHLAALHRFDPSDSNLSSFVAPRPGTTDAIDWRLAAIDRAWAEDSFEAHPVIALTQHWLWDNRPVVDQISIVHGDYRNGNFLFDEESGEITAVLDWELTYLGDRHHDLAYAMMSGWGETDEETGEFYCSAIVAKEEFIQEYERRSGLTVDPVRLEYYTVVNMYWAAVALMATGPRNAAERLTHLDSMQTFLAGLGAFYMDELLSLISPPTARTTDAG